MAARLNTLAYSQTQCQDGGASAAGTAASVPRGSGGPTGFNPRSIQFDIRSPEELAAVNEFLITLGRDVTSGGSSAQARPPPPARHLSSLSGHAHTHTPPADEDANFFDATSLSQLGLAGMPGISTASHPHPTSLSTSTTVPTPTTPSVSSAGASAPGSGAGYHGEGYVSVNDFSHLGGTGGYPSRAAHQSVQPPAHFGMYASSSPDGTLYAREREYARYPTIPNHVQTHYLTPPLDHHHGAGASPLSTHSVTSNSPESTPPPLFLPANTHSHHSYSASGTSGQFGGVPQYDGAAAFDYVRASRAPPPAVQLAAPDYNGRRMRTVIPLKTAPSPETGEGEDAMEMAAKTRPEPVEPRLGVVPTGHRGPPAKLTSENVSELAITSTSVPSSRSANSGVSGAGTTSEMSKKSPLYPLLTSGRPEYKLPPLAAKYRSSSPASSSHSHSASSSPRPSTSSSTATEVASPISRASTLSPMPVNTSTSIGQDVPSPLPSLRSMSIAPLPPVSLYPSAHALANPPPTALAAQPEASSTAAELDHERLVRAVGGIKLRTVSASERDRERRERRRHAALLRDLLVSINKDYKRRFGTPPPPPASPMEVSKDVEMSVA